MKRDVAFRMERPGLLKEGDQVEMTESSLSTLGGTVYYYTIEPALAMSGNIPASERLHTLTARIREVRFADSVYTVIAECE